jgi:hypothetical protein
MAPEIESHCISLDKFTLFMDMNTTKTRKRYLRKDLRNTLSIIKP